MKIKHTLFLLSVVLLGCNLKSYTQTADSSSILEVYQEPMHQLVFEKKELKIIDVQLKPGDTSLFHRHRHPMVFVSLGFHSAGSQVLNQEWKTVDNVWPIGRISSDTAVYQKPMVHRVANNKNNNSRIIGIINTGKGKALNYNTQDYEITNKWFRSKRIVVNKGETISFEKPNYPTILVFVSGDTIDVIKDDKRSEIKTKWYYYDEKNQIVNRGSDKIEMVQIELLN